MPGGIRTLDLLLRRQLLYPAELKAHKCTESWAMASGLADSCFGAGDGNRTHVASLEGWNSTIELHPRMRDDGAVDETRTRDLHLGKVALYQLSYYRKSGALGRNRTTDTVIFSHMLYRLSYQGKWRCGRGSNPRPPA